MVLTGSIELAIRHVNNTRTPVRRTVWEPGIRIEYNDGIAPVLNIKGAYRVFVPEKLDYLSEDWCTIDGALLEEEEARRGFYMAVRYLYVTEIAIKRRAWHSETCVFMKDYTQGSLYIKFQEYGIDSTQIYIPTWEDYLAGDWNSWKGSV